LTNQKIKFYKLINQKMLRSIRSAKWTAAIIEYLKRVATRWGMRRKQTLCHGFQKEEENSEFLQYHLSAR